MNETARRSLIATLVAVVARALALWKLRIVLALLGITLSAAMRPGVEALAPQAVASPSTTRPSPG
jgi:hypothetical protein